MGDELRGFRVVASPDVLRLTRHHVSAVIAADSPPNRAAEREAGRRCAALALAGAGAADLRVGTHHDRSPAWPAGFVGSITHAAGFVSACAAPATELRGIGLDSEAVIAPVVRSEIEATVTRAGELSRTTVAGALDDGHLFTLVFSAKESVYKCLYPIVLQIFDFCDVEMAAVDASARTFRARLLRRFEGLPSGLELDGRFQFDGRLIHTAVELPRAPTLRAT
jgi:enterobactin synthetase component D